MWNRLKELLIQTDQSTSGQPAVHKVLERTNGSREAYADWKFGGDVVNSLDWILSNYQSKISGGKSDRTISFLDTPSKKGFVLYLTDGVVETNHPEHLMDFIKERVLNLGYNLYTSDLRTYSVGNDVETQQRHYLKPPLNFVPNKKLSQLYGNIAIEFVLRNDQPYMFKFSATTYQDYMFDDAKTFGQLMKVICVN